jgi:hypothetical protein
METVQKLLNEIVENKKNVDPLLPKAREILEKKNISVPVPPEPGPDPAADEEIPQLTSFYNSMEDWIDDDMLKRLFETKELVVDVEEYIALLFGKTLTGPMSNKDKIKKIFNHFREGQRGGASLEDFKNYIRQKISEIKPKISQ